MCKKTQNSPGASFTKKWPTVVDFGLKWGVWLEKLQLVRDEFKVGESDGYFGKQEEIWARR